IEKKRPTSEQPEHGAAEPLTAPRAHDGYDDHDDEAQVAPAPDAGDDVVKQPQHGKPSLRQQEKAPEGKEPRVPPISSLEHPEAGATAIGHDGGGGGGEAHAHAHADGDRDGGDGDLEYVDAPPPTGPVPSQGAEAGTTGTATGGTGTGTARGHPYTTTASVVTVSTLGATAVAAGVGVMGGGGETLLAYVKEVGTVVVGSVGGVVYPAAEWVIGMGESIGVPKAADTL
ncbi:hypothetical protein H0H93_011521, partial [Arthromyces matolae]